jgi:hypothetical protein
MNTNDNGDKVIDIDCYCRVKSSKNHCEGNLYIQPDKEKGKRIFYFGMTDTGGDDEATMWLSADQVNQLIKELSILVAEYK